MKSIKDSSEDAIKRRKYALDRYYKKRNELIAALGGRCILCGSTEDLNFDHTDQIDKKFAIGKLLSHSNREVDKEVQKCDLLCFTCHMKKTKDNREHIKNRKHHTKLNTFQVDEIRELLKTSLSLREIGRRFNVSHVTIIDIRDGNHWNTGRVAESGLLR